MRELKVVIVLKEGRVLVGVQTPDCDPVLSSFEGDLSAALQQVPALVDQANQQWDSNPRYPKADLPEEAPVTSPQTRVRQPASKPQSTQQQWF